jgi:hypothetical protein
MQDQQVLVSDQQALNAFQDELPIQLGRAAFDGADQPVDEDPVPALAPQQQAGQSRFRPVIMCIHPIYHLNIIKFIS